MMKPFSPLVVLPVAVLVELTLLVLVGQWTGGLWVVAWTILSFFIGTRLWAHMQDGGPVAARDLWAARMGALDTTTATRTAANAALLGLAGLLLVIPGLVTDAAGLLLAVGPIRQRVVDTVVARTLKGQGRGPTGPAAEAWSGRRARRSAHATVDVEVIPPEDAPQSPFVHQPRVITVEPGTRR